MRQRRNILLISRDAVLLELLEALFAFDDSYSLTPRSPAETTPPPPCVAVIVEGVERKKISRTIKNTPLSVIGKKGDLKKPFRFADLLGVLARTIGRAEQQQATEITIGDYLFRPVARVLVGREGQEISLSEKETDILQYLRFAPAPVPRDTLLAQIWGYRSSVDTHTLETHIYRLRQKLERDPASAEILVHREGGYLLIANP